MKKTILAIVILFSINLSAQTKADTLQQIKVNKFLDSMSRSPVKDFQKFIYENVTAKKHDEFMAMYNAYLEAMFKQKN